MAGNVKQTQMVGFSDTCHGSIPLLNISHRLRIHNEQEWRDWPFHQEDLASFFDCFLKDIKNDWLSTPPIRVSLLGMSKPDIINRPFPSYPPPSMSLRTYYFDAHAHVATMDAVTEEHSVSYSGTDIKSEATFDITFTEYTEIVGNAKLSLWMQCHEHDDMDIHAILCKLDKNGKVIRHVNYPPEKIRHEELPLNNVVQYQGPTAAIRASHRKWQATHPSYSEIIPLDSQGTVDDPSPVWDGKKELWHPHMKGEKISKGEIVKVEFTTWPMGMVFDKDEKMRVRVSGRDMCLVETAERKFAIFVDSNCCVHVHDG